MFLVTWYDQQSKQSEMTIWGTLVDAQEEYAQRIRENGWVRLSVVIDTNISGHPMKGKDNVPKA